MSYACYALLVVKSLIGPQNKKNAGLCADCVHARWIQSDRDSTFLLCELSVRNPSFPKYPRLPVLSCSGYEKKASGV